MQIDPLELVAALLGVVCVWLTVVQHIGCWPTGLAMVTLYLYIFFREGLYSDMLLQGVYIVLQGYGWYAWLYGAGNDQGKKEDSRQTALAVSRMPRWQIVPWMLTCFLMAAALGTFMHQIFDASLPYVDAFTTVASLIAQWLMGRKVLESWLVWILVDVISIGMYFTKGLNLTAVLYAIFLGLAIWGWFEWSSAWRKAATV